MGFFLSGGNGSRKRGGGGSLRLEIARTLEREGFLRRSCCNCWWFTTEILNFPFPCWTDATFMFSVKLMQAQGEREKSMSERRSEIKDDRRQFVAFFRPAQLNARRVWGSAQNRKERDKTNDGRHFFPRSSTCASRSFRLLRLPNKRNKKWHQLDMFWLFICSFFHFFRPFLYYCFPTNRYPH